MKFKLICAICVLVLTSTVLSAQPSVGGTLNSSTDSVCYGVNSVTLSLSGQVGVVQYWEMSNSLSGPWFTISNVNSSMVVSDLTQTSYFRAIVKNGMSPSDTSTVEKIVVSPLSVGGSISGAAEVCASSNSGQLHLTGYTGFVTRWQSSNDGGVNWNNISNTTDFQNYNNLSQTVIYKAEIKSGVCSSVYSDSVLITVSNSTNAGVLSGAANVCAGTNSGFFDLNGYQGEIVQWEKSQTGNDPWIVIQSINDTLYYNNLTETGYYRAMVQSGVCGSEYSNSVLLDVSQPVNGGIVTGQGVACSGSNSGTVLLSDYTGDIINWQYSHDFGTNWNDTANITHTLNYSNLLQTTSFRALVNSGACGNDFSEFATIVVHPKPVVSFSFDTVCYTHATTFQNNSSISSGNIVSNSWDFGNGDGNNSYNPVYTYSSHGNYTVKLIVMSNHSCIDSTVAIVPVRPSPIVNFFTEDVCDRDTVNFENYSFTPGGGVLNYIWSFGDNTTSGDENPFHIYSDAGDYSVQLIVSHSVSGCTDSLTRDLEVFPRVNPSFLFNNVCLGAEMNFQNTSILQSGNASYFWSFGDGGSSTKLNPEHFYTESGSYDVVLTAVTNNYCTDTLSVSVDVNPQPIAEFSFEDVCFTDSTHFINETVYDENDINYNWSFGNGNSSDTESPVHYYSSPGTYLVNLTVSTDSLCQNSVSHFVNVNSLPDVNFMVDDVCLYNLAQFQNQTTYQWGDVDYLWDFDNMQTSDLQSPEIQFSSAGDYNIKLIATINGMCTDSIEKNLKVFPIPQVGFISTNVCDGEQSYFFDDTQIESGSINSFQWDFGDGTNSMQQNPVKQFLNPGTYQVNLSVTSNYGCIAETTEPVTVDFMPIANFVVNSVCDGTPINPLNQSFIQSGQMFFDWDFGDSDTSVLSEPNHLYDSPGFYRLRLLVNSQNGCIDSLIRYVQVYSLPQISAGDDFLISKGDEVQLSGNGAMIYNWFPSTYLSNSIISNPISTPPETIQYILQGEDINGCINTDTVQIVVEEDFKLFPNNIITPDGNGYNDTWKIRNIENYSSCTVNIFDRAGNLVFSKQAYNNDWNGENMNGDILPDATYYYVISFEDSEVIYKGSVSLLRNR